MTISEEMKAQGPDVAEIAKSLTEADKALMLEMTSAWKLADVSEVYRLNARGLTIGRKTSFGEYAVRLTETGLAVRAYLKNSQSGDAIEAGEV